MLIQFILVKSISVNDKYINYFLSPKMLTNVIRPQTHCLFIFVISFEWFHFTLVCSLFVVQAHRGLDMELSCGAGCVCCWYCLIKHSSIAYTPFHPLEWGTLKSHTEIFKTICMRFIASVCLISSRNPIKLINRLILNDTRFRNVFEHRRAQRHRHRQCNPRQPKVN